MTSTIDATCIGRCPDTDMIVYQTDVRIFFTWQPACGDGWYEPREPAHAEFERAGLVVDGPGSRCPVAPAPAAVEAWAKQWLEDHQKKAAAVALTALTASA